MNLQQYRFKFLTITKNLFIVILGFGFILTVINILDFNKARRIEMMNGPEIRQFVNEYKVERASLRSLMAVAKKTLEVNPQEIDASEKATSAILNKKKNCLDCYNRIVFFDIYRNEDITPVGLRALHSSYDLSPYGAEDLMKWRLEVSSKFWEKFDDDLKKYSLTQITALSQHQQGRFWLRNFETDVEEIKERVGRSTY
ncbi:MAG: hypothetical protein HKO02_15375 [Hyphomonadaceae bacterium]|nr:hypothetical protein [Hyphomonadaceae bacterium]